MGLSWQQGPLSAGAIGQFLVPEPLPARLLFAEPLRRRMRVLFGGRWIAASDDVVLLHEPGRYPVAYFPLADVEPGALEVMGHRTRHRDLGPTAWFVVRVAATGAERAAWQHVDLPAHATVLEGRVAFAWRAMDAFYEEDERIVGHAADPYHRNDARRTSRHLVVREAGRVVADSRAPLVLYESGFAPRWYVPRDDIDPRRPGVRRAGLARRRPPAPGQASSRSQASMRAAAWSRRWAPPPTGSPGGLP
jgi:uncharacterized protein (DUF427 family)